MKLHQATYKNENESLHCLHSSLLVLLFLLAGWLNTLQAQSSSIHLFDNVPASTRYFEFTKMGGAPDGGYAALHVEAGSGRVYVLRFDACGELIWSRLLEIGPMFRPSRSSDVVFSDDGVLHIGVMYFGNPGGAFHLVQLDPKGELLANYAWYADRMSAGVNNMGIMPDGQLFIAGLNHPPTGPVDFVALIGPNGKLSPVHGFLRSSAGYQTVGTVTPEGHVLMRRGDHFYLVNPYTGKLIWDRALIAPLYNGVIPLETENGWILMGQFSNSVYKYNALPMFLDKDGNFLFLGELFPANGNAFTNIENIQLRRVAPLSANRFVTVTTDSLDTGYLVAVIFSDQGQVIEQRYINPFPDQFRMLNHDFVLLDNEVLAIAANVNGRLGIIHVPLAGSPGCNTTIENKVIPYQTSVSDHSTAPHFMLDTLSWQQVTATATVKPFDLQPGILCADSPVFPDKETTLEGCPDDLVLVDASYPGATGYMWDSGDSTAVRAVIAGHDYTVQVQVGCQFFQHIFRIKTFEECACTINLPNVFTPNGDGVNDTFGEWGMCNYSAFQLTVFNRWGQVVFETNDAGQKWNGVTNGTPQPSDEYVYIVEWISGLSGKILKRRGSITLVR
ncbi:MAG: gliding motility-associated C-terminal domain-containing protein [Saprospiraceae bacterium]|nr:gliding motility-associated C-terminal domain-containing protein [Saprospiraceae bacterium]